jgi:diguanylate cyclase (GGDEF)-like protein
LALEFGYVVVRLLTASRGQPPVAAWRMRILSVALVGLALPVVVAVTQAAGPNAELAAGAVTVAMGVLLLLVLVPPGVRLLCGHRGDAAFLRATRELVSAGRSEEVADGLLPHVAAVVGASEVALVAADGTVVARHPLWLDRDIRDLWGTDRAARPGAAEITRRTTSATTHRLVARISAYLPYFGTAELEQLEVLADLAGRAIERGERAEQVAFQASHDGLTGLANRSLFMERLDEALRHVGRRRASLAVLFIDLDRFKLVNDRADHAAGDLVLNEMADRMVTMTRGVDVVARFGGDEFVALAEVDHEDDARDMAERIRRGLAAPLTVGDTRLVVTASIGVVVTADSSLSPAAVLREADDAMYEAKRVGRDLVVLHHGSAREAANSRWRMPGARAPRVSAG